MSTETAKKETPKAIDLSALPVEEIFSYLGKKYVIRLKTEYLRDDKGELVAKEFKTPGVGSIYDGYVTTTPTAELFGVKEIIKSNRATIAEFKRPLTVEVQYVGPLDPAKEFKYDDEPIVLDNKELADRTYTPRKGKIVKSQA